MNITDCNDLCRVSSVECNFESIKDSIYQKRDKKKQYGCETPDHINSALKEKIRIFDTKTVDTNESNGRNGSHKDSSSNEMSQIELLSSDKRLLYGENHARCEYPMKEKRNAQHRDVTEKNLRHVTSFLQSDTLCEASRKEGRHLGQNEFQPFKQCSNKKDISDTKHERSLKQQSHRSSSREVSAPEQPKSLNNKSLQPQLSIDTLISKNRSQAVTRHHNRYDRSTLSDTDQSSLHIPSSSTLSDKENFTPLHNRCPSNNQTRSFGPANRSSHYQRSSSNGQLLMPNSNESVLNGGQMQQIDCSEHSMNRHNKKAADRNLTRNQSLSSFKTPKMNESSNSRDNSTERQTEAEKKLQQFKYAKKVGSTICVCGASAYWERERITLGNERSRLKEETDRLRGAAQDLREKRQKMQTRLLEIQAKEELIDTRLAEVNEKEEAAAEESQRIEAREKQLRSEQKVLDEQKEEFLLTEKELELAKKRLERETNEVKGQMVMNKQENARLTDVSKKLQEREIKLEATELQLNMEIENLENARRELRKAEEDYQKKSQELDDAQALANEEKIRLIGWEETLHRRESDIKQRRSELEGIILINERRDQALKRSSDKNAIDQKKLEMRAQELARIDEELTAKQLQWQLEQQTEKEKMNLEVKKGRTQLDEELVNLNIKKSQLKKKEEDVLLLEVNLEEREKQLSKLKSQLDDQEMKIKGKEKLLTAQEEDNKRIQTNVDKERRLLMIKKTELEERESQVDIKVQLLSQQTEQFQIRLKELEEREVDVERGLQQIKKQFTDLELRDAVVSSKEARSDWYQNVMKEVVDQKEKYELLMQDLELEKNSFSEMKNEFELNQDRSLMTLKTRQEALAQLEIAIQQKAREIQRQEQLLNTRIAQESGSLKHKLLTLSSGPDLKTNERSSINKAKTSYHDSEPLGERHRSVVSQGQERACGSYERAYISPLRALRMVPSLALLENTPASARLDSQRNSRSVRHHQLDSQGGHTMSTGYYQPQKTTEERPISQRSSREGRKMKRPRSSSKPRTTKSEDTENKENLESQAKTTSLEMRLSSLDEGLEDLKSTVDDVENKYVSKGNEIDEQQSDQYILDYSWDYNDSKKSTKQLEGMQSCKTLIEEKVELTKRNIPLDDDELNELLATPKEFVQRRTTPDDLQSLENVVSHDSCHEDKENSKLQFKELSLSVSQRELEHPFISSKDKFEQLMNQPSCLSPGLESPLIQD